MTLGTPRSRDGVPWDLVAVLSLGLAVSVALIAGTPGEAYDVGNAEAFGREFRVHHLHAYDAKVEGLPRWPYPPAWLPAMLFSDTVSAHTPFTFAQVFRFFSVLATLALAALVWSALGQAGAQRRERMTAAALIAVGPAFLAASAVHGQVDVAAFLPATAALVLWQRLGPQHAHRALWCGLLIGLGAGIKTVPVFLVLALLPHVRNWREGFTLLSSAAAVPVALLLPFVLSEPHATVQTFRYNGAPGVGGLSLLAQPRLADGWFATGQLHLSSTTDALQSLAPVLTIGALALLALLLLHKKPQPWLGASLIVLVLWVFGVNFFLHYAVWGMPFFLMMRWWRGVLLVQLTYLIPLYFRYHEDVLGTAHPSATQVEWIYTPTMMALWAVAAVALVRGIRRADEGLRPQPRTGESP